MSLFNTEDFGFFRLAKGMALKSPHPDFKIGAVLCNKRPISAGFNQFEKTDPTVKPWDEGRQQRLCAERHACKGVKDEDLKGATLYVWRQTPGGRQALAAPCPSCLKFIVDKGLKLVYYTTDKSYIILSVPEG